MTGLLLLVAAWLVGAAVVIRFVHRATTPRPTPPFPPDPLTTWQVPDDVAGLQAELDGAR